MNVFTDPEGWEARLRQQTLVTRSARARGEDVSVTSSIAVVDARFQLGLLDMLSNPMFLGVERQTEGGLTHLIYEAIAPKPTHFQELGMNVATPTIIRREMLQTIDQSWGKSDESWIDIVAVPTNHRMDTDGDKVDFKKTRLGGLVGAKVHILSRDAVDEFLSIKDGACIADLLGFDLPLKVNMQNLVRYHSACLGFTGSGKSNFTTHLIREAMKAQPDLRVIIFDIAGEYFVHLADMFSKKNSVIYTSEPFESIEQFLDSQVIPETLEERLEKSQVMEQVAKSVMSEGRLRSIVTGEETTITLGFVLAKLAGIGDKAGAVQAAIIGEKLRTIMAEEKLRSDTPIAELKAQAREKVKDLAEEAAVTAPDRSSLKGDMSQLVSYFESAPEIPPEKSVSASELARIVLEAEGGSLSVVYVPEPKDARLIVSRFIDRILNLKKTAGKAKEKVLIVLDEAQEYIPRDRKDNYTDMSNIAVEALLRQGRKYRAHCWLGSQRVAHLNVSALQQVHSYFINILPRSYDRITIAEAFGVSYDLLDRTLDLETGQWLFVSYKATKRKNVPVFIQAPNNEAILAQTLA